MLALPSTMILIGGYNDPGPQYYGMLNDAYCPDCGVITQWVLLRRKGDITLFFMPLIPVKRDALVQCAQCHTSYLLNNKGFQHFKRTADLTNALQAGKITPDEYNQYWVNAPKFDPADFDKMSNSD